MLRKLAVRNVRRSFRDYAIYFVTLAIGVATFYAFNSIGSQQVLFDLEESATSARMFDLTDIMMGIFSVAIAFVLGFLVIYANQMLIRRRKHEFGIYLALGMGPASISGLVIMETFIVGVFALAIGILLGLALSQLLCFLTAALFDLVIADYVFVFSLPALVSTAICFAVIFAVVAAFNLVMVNGFKVRNLLQPDHGSGRVASRHPLICLATFLISLAAIVASYVILERNGMLSADSGFWVATACMAVGSLALLWSIGGFAVSAISMSKRAYLRGLVPFTLKQVTGKLDSAFISVWAICMLLFVGITTFSSGMAFAQIFTSDIEEATPYEVTVYANLFEQEADMPTVGDYVRASQSALASSSGAATTGEAYGWELAPAIAARMPEWGDLVSSSSQIDLWYLPGTTYASLLSDPDAIAAEFDVDVALGNNAIAVSRTAYDMALEQQGLPSSDAPSGSAILLNDFGAVDPISDDIMASNSSIPFLDTMIPLAPMVESTQLWNSAMPDTTLIFVMPDDAVRRLGDAGILPERSFLNIDLVGGEPTTDAFDSALEMAYPSNREAPEDAATGYVPSPWPVSHTYSRVEMVEQAQGFRMLVTYLALYIGLVFLVSIAAMLAIQQLSLIIDSQRRYLLLWKLGCDRRMLSGSMFAQICIYFIVPLALALAHSAFAIHVLQGEMLGVLSRDLFIMAIPAIILVVVIYGGYMVMTYLVGNGMMRETIRGT